MAPLSYLELLCLVSLSHVIPRTVACRAPLSEEFSRPEYWGGLPCPPPGDLPNPGVKPRSSTLQADSLPSEPPGKPVNTGVGSLSLLQGFFPTQGSNPGLPHCRRILYQLNHREAQEIGVSSISLLQQIFPTQESNRGSPALPVDSLQLS